MRLLFIKPKQIGDSLILTPTLTATRAIYPKAEIWVAVRRGCDAILAGCPEIDRVLTLAAVEKRERTSGDFVREVGILALLATTPFDCVFELGDGHRARLFARAARTKRRYSVKTDAPLKGRAARAFTGIARFNWHSAHRVLKDYRSVAEFIPLPEEVPPLRFDRSLTRSWAPAVGLRDFAVLQTGTRQGFNRWTLEGWRAVCAYLLTQFEKVVVTGGAVPNDKAEADALRREFGERVLCTRGEADWSQMADLLYRARLYVGPPTAAMHLAAACQCPIVVILGRTIEDHWAPWQVPYRAVSTINVTQIKDAEERYRRVKEGTMRVTPPQDVIDACDELLASLRRNAVP